MYDVSASGIKLRVLAFPLYPAGFDVSRFPDDASPLEIDNQQIADTGMGVNGDLVAWSTPNPIEMSVSVIPGSEEDDALASIWAVDRIGGSKIAAFNKITIVVTYPSGKVVTYTGGKMIEGPAGTSTDNSARLQSKTYRFAFETVI